MELSLTSQCDAHLIIEDACLLSQQIYHEITEWMSHDNVTCCT